MSQNNYQYQQPNNYGYGYGVPRPQAKNTQPLTQEQINKLRSDGNAFDLKISQEDLWRASCTHKEKNGKSTLISNPDGSYTCTICNATFRMPDYTVEEVTKAVNVIHDIVQTAKTLWLDAPEAFVSSYSQSELLIRMLPAVWERAINNFAMYEGAINPNMNPVYPAYSGFAAINNIISNPYYGTAYGYGMAQPAPVAAPYGAPTMGMDQQPPMAAPYGMYTQPPMAAPYGMPTMGGVNPLAYGTPGAAPAPTAPVAPAPGAMPGMAQPAPVAAPAQNVEVQQQQVFNV